MSLNAGNLFRPEALDNSYTRLEGKVILINVPGLTKITVLLVTIIVTSLIFVSQASFSTYESVDGILKSAGSVLKVYPRQNSVITKLNVEEGQHVKAGDDLLSLRNNATRIAGTSGRELEKIELEFQLGNLDTKKNTMESRYQFEREKLNIRINNNIQKISTLARKISLLHEREKIMNALYQGKQKMLADGGISQNDVNTARIDYLLVQEDLHDRQAERKESQGALKQLNYDVKALPVNQRAESANIDNEISQMKKQLIQLQGQIEYTLQARQAGVVSNIVALEGEAVSANFPLLAITAAEEDLLAELYIPSRAIGFIKKGLKVYIRFDAFPHQHYGDIEGEVYEMSNVLLFPTEWPNPLILQVPVYRIKVKLSADTILAKGQQIKLQRGLRLNADIVLEEKTVLEYLLSPLLEIKNKMH